MIPSSDTAMLRLPEVLDVTAAAPLIAGILAVRGRRLVLDASGVQRLGGLCLQVLLSARADWERAATPFSVANPSSAFTSGLGQLGVAPFPVGPQSATP